jgi:hypothetical protein
MSAVAPFRLANSGYRTKLALPAGLLVAIFLLIISGNLAGNGVLGFTLNQSVFLNWNGSVLQLLTGWMASGLSPMLDLQTGLVLIYVMLATLAAAMSYRLLRGNDWPAWQALLVLGLIAGQGMMLLSITAATPEFLLVLALGILIPTCRRLEAIGDVQAIINYALTLPLLLLAGPALALLLPLLILMVPLREEEARQKPSVFAAMIIVAAIPVLIIMAGLAAMAARAGVDLQTMAAPFLEVFGSSSEPLIPSLLLLVLTAPVTLGLTLHLFVPDRRRKVLTTLFALLAPVYLAIGNTLFGWGFSAWLPAAAMLATSLGWLSATRVRSWLRLVVLALLGTGLVSSWALAWSWAAPAWQDGLLPIRLFSYQFG